MKLFINSKSIQNQPYLNTLFNKVLYCVITFLANALLTRALGLSLKGEYAWILNYANMIGVVSGLGIYQSAPFFIRNRPGKDWFQEYINIFTLQAFSYLILAVVIGCLFHQTPTVLFIGILAVTDNFCQQLNMLLLINKITARNRIYTLGAIINLLLSIAVFLLVRSNLYAAIFATLIVKAFYIIAYLSLGGKLPHPLQTNWKMVWEKIHFGYLAMFSFLLIIMNYKIDVIMLKAYPMVSSEQLSLYTTGVSIAEIAWVIPDVFKDVLFSRTTDKRNDKEVVAALRISNAVIFIFIVGIIFLGRLFIKLFFGSVFLPAYLVTVLLFLGILPMSWFKIVYMLFNAQGRRRTSFSVLLLSALLNIVLNAILIPSFGIYGAACASIASYGLCGLLFLAIYAVVSKQKFFALFIINHNDLKTLFRRREA